MNYTEGYIEYDDGNKIRYWLNNKKKNIDALFLHGLGERLEMYEYLFPLFEKNGIALHLLELRGHGLTTGKPKYIKDFSLYTKDVRRFIDEYLDGRPLFLVGHSTGALVSLRLAENRNYDIKGMALTSPIVNIKANPLLKLLVSLAGKVMPNFVVPDKEEAFFGLSHDKEFVQQMIDESKRTIFGITLGYGGALMREQKKFMQESDKLKERPLYMLLPEFDARLNIPLAEQRFREIYSDTDNFQLEHCDGACHAILGETNKEEYVKKIVDWIKTQNKKNS